MTYDIITRYELVCLSLVDALCLSLGYVSTMMVFLRTFAVILLRKANLKMSRGLECCKFDVQSSVLYEEAAVYC